MEEHFGKQKDWLADFWTRSDVEIEGQPTVQQAVRWNIFQLAQSTARTDGGGIAANLARVLPRSTWVEVDRSTWSPPPVFRVLADLGGLELEATEGTWNLGIGFVAVVAADRADAAASALAQDGIAAWQVGVIRDGARPDQAHGAFEQGAKGVDGGAVRLVGNYNPGGAN